MQKNTDPKAIVISREIFNRLIRDLEAEQPEEAAALKRHVSRFNPHYKKEIDRRIKEDKRIETEGIAKVKEFVEANRGKTVWLDDSFLPRVTCDRQMLEKICGIEEPGISAEEVSIRTEKVEELWARQNTKLTVPVKVITKSPGGLAIVLELPRAEGERKGVRIHSFLDRVLLERPADYLDATEGELKTLKLLCGSTREERPEVIARVMRENYIDRVRNGEGFVNLTYDVTITTGEQPSA